VIAPLRRKTVVFAGGGTGGHLFPALAVARALPGLEPVFVVPPDRGDAERVDGEFRCVPAASPRVDRGWLMYAPRLAVAVNRTRQLLRRLDACAVVGLGGYASIPASVAAKTLGLPLYLMECNAVPGKATRLMARYAAGVGLGADSARAHLAPRVRARVTGTPLREELRQDARPEDFGLRAGLPTLLVLGGSQGAMGLNTRVFQGLVSCQDLAFQVLHCAGARDVARVEDAYRALERPARVVDFLPDIGRAYAVADLVISRAGASTVAECLALGRPAVFVPYPWHRDRQQAHNASGAARAGAARIVAEGELTPAVLRAIVEELLLDKTARLKMATASASLGCPQAARTMAAHLVESLGSALVQSMRVTEFGG